MQTILNTFDPWTFLVVLFVFILICDVFMLKESGKRGKCGNFVTVRPILFRHNLNVLSHSGILWCSLHIRGGTVDGWPVLPARYLSNVNKYPRKRHARSSLHVCRDPAVHTDRPTQQRQQAGYCPCSGRVVSNMWCKWVATLSTTLISAACLQWV